MHESSHQSVERSAQSKPFTPPPSLSKFQPPPHASLCIQRKALVQDDIFILLAVDLLLLLWLPALLQLSSQFSHNINTLWAIYHTQTHTHSPDTYHFCQLVFFFFFFSLSSSLFFFFLSVYCSHTLSVHSLERVEQSSSHHHHLVIARCSDYCCCDRPPPPPSLSITTTMSSNPIITAVVVQPPPSTSTSSSSSSSSSNVPFNSVTSKQQQKCSGADGDRGISIETTSSKATTTCEVQHLTALQAFSSSSSSTSTSYDSEEEERNRQLIPASEDSALGADSYDDCDPMDEQTTSTVQNVLYSSSLGTSSSQQQQSSSLSVSTIQRLVFLCVCV